MKISEAALRTWTNPPIDRKTLTDQLTMLGLEVDGVLPAAPEFSGVVVGHVKTVSQHPNADRLRVCEVDIKMDECLNIVCGASNVRADLKVAVAKVGAVLPNNFKIKSAKLRGIASSGMICSRSELGLAESSQGILELPDDAPVGEDFRHYFQLDDHIIDIDLTPNRGDCLSVQGIAREVAARNQCALKPTEIKPVAVTIADALTVNVVEPDVCPRYFGRIIRGIDPKVKSPVWLQEQLRRAGIRSVNLIVDCSQWVMLELGQPLHCFDLNKLSGDLIVRFGQPEEQVKLLDDTVVTVDEKTLCLADNQGVQALAGVMGADQSAVDDHTTDIFIESAFFVPLAISGIARRFGLSSESAFRFERGVDPVGQQAALERISELIVTLAQGKAGPIIAVASAAELKPTSIQLPYVDIKRLLGFEIDQDEIIRILKSLNMTVEVTSKVFFVTPPAYRFDLKLPADIIEELLRLTGFERLPNWPLSLQPLKQSDASLQLKSKRLEDCLINRDYHEVINYSFIDPEWQSLLFPNVPVCKLANPISADLAAMRTSLWPGLIKALQYNEHRQQVRIRLFERGLCFQSKQDEIDQVECLAGIVTGPKDSENWAEQARSVDFFDVKGDVEALLTVAGHTQVSFLAQPHSALHPGQSAQLSLNEQPLGWLGRLHPQLCQTLNLSDSVFVFEFILAPLKTAMIPQFTEVSKFPAVRRDIALVVDQAIAVNTLLAAINQSASNLLKKVHVFDIYQGEHIDSMKKSVALGLIFQDNGKTLTDDDINNALKPIIQMLAQQFAATLRT